jgi:hypothetical protein
MTDKPSSPRRFCKLFDVAGHQCMVYTRPIQSTFAEDRHWYGVLYQQATEQGKFPPPPDAFERVFIATLRHDGGWTEISLTGERHDMLTAFACMTEQWAARFVEAVEATSDSDQLIGMINEWFDQLTEQTEAKTKPTVYYAGNA